MLDPWWHCFWFRITHLIANLIHLWFWRRRIWWVFIVSTSSPTRSSFLILLVQICGVGIPLGRQLLWVISFAFTHSDTISSVTVTTATEFSLHKDNFEIKIIVAFCVMQYAVSQHGWQKPSFTLVQRVEYSIWVLRPPNCGLKPNKFLWVDSLIHFTESVYQNKM